MLFGVLGDLHGDFDAMERAFATEPGVAVWLSVGDVASDAGQYPAPSRPFLFIKGNNEDFDVIARLAAERAAERLRLIPNGTALDLPGSASPAIRVAGLGGTFAPTWYDTLPEALPPARAPSRVGAARADKRRHFVRAEVETCLALRGVDLFLTHEAPRPYWVGVGRRRNDAGKAVVNEILASLRPRLHVFGHHHRHSETVCEGVPSIGLPLASDGYLVVESEGWNWTFRDLSM
jgi:hypothetical protein